ncbi:MAG: metal ABC transporter solute-binding protein, Zn/Mn family [Caldilinea sp.]
MKRSILRMQWLSVVVILSLLLSACTAVAPVAPSADNDVAGPLKVVATYSVLGDLVQQVAGDKVEMTVLVGADGDPHVYEPTPRDAVALSEAAILFENGLEFEPWLEDLLAASSSQAARVAVSDGVDTLAFDAHGQDGEHADHAHGDVAPKRIAIADGVDPSVHLLDVGAGELLVSYDVAGPARVYVGADETLAYAVQTTANQVNVIDSGVRFVPHEDHYHLDLTDPALLDFTLDGTTPIHFVAHDGVIAIFNDGDGTAAIFDESAVRGDGQVITVDSGRPHHGVAVPMEDVVVISLPNPDDPEAALPAGVVVRTLDGAEVAAFPECPGLHGEASIGHDAIAFGCTDGVLILERGDDTWTTRKIANPADNPDNARVGTLYYNEASGLLVGNWSRQGFTQFDLEAGVMTPVILPVPMWAFTWSEYDPHQVLALTIDGSLHTIDYATGEILASVPVVDAFALPQQGEEGVLRPALIASGDMAYISSPNTGEVVEVHTPHMEVDRRLAVEGAPFSLAAFGAMVDPQAGEHMHGEAEAQADDHGHVHGEFDPHTWMSPLNAIVMVENIRDALVAADPANADLYAANAAAYVAELQQLDAEMRAQIDTIPVEHRKLVTTHELFSYFARDYGFELLGSALGSVTTEAADPGAGQIATLVEEIRTAVVPAIFVEDVGNPALMERIAQEAGVTVAPPLYTHGLGQAGSGAEDYLGMMRTNMQIIVEALQ